MVYFNPYDQTLMFMLQGTDTMKEQNSLIRLIKWDERKEKKITKIAYFSSNSLNPNNVCLGRALSN